MSTQTSVNPSEVSKGLPEDRFTDDCTEILKHMELGFESNLAERLRTGELCYNLLMREKGRRGDKFKRSDVINALAQELFKRSSLDITSIRPTDWIAVFQTAYLYFGTSDVGSWDQAHIARLSYGILSIVATLTTRDHDENYAVQKGCVELFRSILDHHTQGRPERLHGAALRERIADFRKDLAIASETSKKSSASPDRVEASERRKENAEVRSKQNARVNAVNHMMDSMEKTGVTKPADIVRAILNSNLITKEDIHAAIPPAPMVPAQFAAIFTEHDCVGFVDALFASGKTAVVFKLISLIQSKLKSAKQIAEQETKAEAEGLSIRVAV